MANDLDLLLSGALRERDARRTTSALDLPKRPAAPVVVHHWRDVAYVKLHYRYVCTGCGSDTRVLEGNFLERCLLSHPTTTRLTRLHSGPGPDLPLHKRDILVEVSECVGCEA